MADSGGEVFYEAVDWRSIVEKREREISNQRGRINRLENLLKRQELRIADLKEDLYARNSKYETLREENLRMRRRLQWLERKEEEVREREKVKRRKREREHEIQEEVRMRVRVEEEERQRIREEIRQEKGKSTSFDSTFNR
jgi:chromosome segregation ATPase